MRISIIGCVLCVVTKKVMSILPAMFQELGRREYVESTDETVLLDVLP